MKRILFLTCFSIFSFSLLSNEKPEVVTKIDIEKYMGEWHQVAAIPAFFQKKCAKNTRAQYSLEGDEIVVKNSCEKKNGKRTESVGRARLNPKYKKNSKLQVTFVQLFYKWVWAFGGDYWVLDTDKNHTYSIVGSPNFKYLWILSRSPSLDEKTLKKHAKTIQSKGFSLDSILITQEGELDGKPLSSLSGTKKD